jgi:hypothetical protein
MKIAIPTYNRPELKSYDLACSIVGEENVYVFFHNQADREQYRADIKNVVITGLPKGIGGARNAILNYFKQGEEIIMMDDDISEITRLSLFDKKRVIVLKPKEALFEFKLCFDTIKAQKAYLWGVYPVNNAFYMARKVNGKCFIIGWIMGIIVNELRFDEQMPTKEDYDYAIQNIKKYKKVARFDYLSCNAKYQAKGGLDYVYGTEKEKQAFQMLMDKWEGIVVSNPNRPNEVILRI